jgi:hypothetical protein
MPTLRNKIAPTRRFQITPEAIAAWKAGDYWALHDALKLNLYEMPDWCPRGTPHRDTPSNPVEQARQDEITEMQRQLIEIAGPPPMRWYYHHPDGERDTKGKILWRYGLPRANRS